MNELADSYQQSNTDSMLAIARRAHLLAAKLNYNKGIAYALFNTGIAHRHKGDYTAALQNLQQAIGLFDKEGLVSAGGNAYIQLAQVYKDMSGHNLTEEYLRKCIYFAQQAYQHYQSIQDAGGMANALNMQGISYRDMGRIPGKKHFYDTAFRLYNQALHNIQQSGQGTQHTGKLYNNISQVYLEYKKDYTTALEYLFKAVDFNKAHQNYSSLSFNYGNISSAYVRLRQPTQALLYAREMTTAAQQSNRPERLVNAWRQMHESFKALGKNDSALQYYVRADRLEDSLNNVAKTNEVVALQAKYESAKKESQILQLQAESSAKTKRIIYLVIGVMLFAALAGCLLWLYGRVKKQRQQIALQSRNLETMMKELHHRVKNNLQIVSSLLSLQTYKVQDEGAVSVLKESQQRVQAMSFIHQRLYKKEELTSVNMKEYLTDLAESLVASYGFDRDGFDLRIDTDREMMDIDKALPIGLIINEMVTNSLKYAYRDIQHPSLFIALKEDANHLTFVIRDNGIGIDEEAWKRKNNSFGKQLITALCKQLRAKQTMVIDGGTSFTVTIPKQVA